VRFFMDVVDQSVKERKTAVDDEEVCDMIFRIQCFVLYD